MSVINTLKSALASTVFEKTVDYLDNIYSVFTALNGLANINGSIIDTRKNLNDLSENSNSLEYQELKSKLDGLIYERNAQYITLTNPYDSIGKNT